MKILRWTVSKSTKQSKLKQKPSWRRKLISFRRPFAKKAPCATTAQESHYSTQLGQLGQLGQQPRHQQIQSVKSSPAPIYIPDISAIPEILPRIEQVDHLDADNSSMRSVPSMYSDQGSTPSSNSPVTMDSPMSLWSTGRPQSMIEDSIVDIDDIRPATSHGLNIEAAINRANPWSLTREWQKSRTFGTSIPDISEHSPNSGDPSEDRDDCLILTMTSKYPTGLAADLYVPEDLSYDVVMKRQKEMRKAQFRNSLSRSFSTARRTPAVQNDADRKRRNRLSVNF